MTQIVGMTNMFMVPVWKAEFGKAMLKAGLFSIYKVLPTGVQSKPKIVWMWFTSGTKYLLIS